MKLLARFLVVGALVLASSSTVLRAQTGTPVATKHPLWKVEGGKSTVYLLGSIHFLRDDSYPLAQPIEAAFTGARTVMFEVDLAEQNQPATQAKMLKAGVSADGKKLSERLKSKTYEALKAHLGRRGLPAETLEPLQPWLAAVTIVVIELQRLGFSPEAGVDKHFHGRAVKDGKRVLALETVDQQMALFTGLSGEDSDAFVEQTVRDIAQFEKLFTDIIQAWKTGNAARLDELLLKEMKAYPHLLKSFLSDRNRAWIPALEKQLQGAEPTLVVVGAGHLVGKDSVVDLLRKKGYKVTQQ